MLGSVVGVGLGSGALVQRGGDQPQFNPGVGGPSTVVVDQSKPVVFQGEDDIDLVDPSGAPLSASQLIGVSGDAEGQPLEIPIPRDQARGQYALNGQSNQPGVTVQTPRVTDLELFNENGIDVEGSSVQEDETLLVAAEWNFQDAEDLELVVRDERGNDITGDVLADAADLGQAQLDRLSGPYAGNPEAVANPGQRGTGTGIVYLQGTGQFNETELQNTTLDTAYWALDLSDQDAGDYTISVQGWDTLDFGTATESTSVRVTSENDVTLDLADDRATRGENVRYTIRGSSAGSSHYVVIEDDDFRNDQVDAEVFRDIQDVIDRGTFDTDDDGQLDFAWAQVEINEDTGLGVGQVDTSFLDDASITLDLYQADRSLSSVAEDLGDTEDDVSITIEEGELSFDSPAGTYIAGQEVDVRGQAAPGVDDVFVYARDQGDWELVDVNEDGQLDESDAINVDSTGEWEQEDVVLSQASDILSIPGRYRIGVVEAADARGNDGAVREALTTSEFSSATSAQSSIIVQNPDLDTARAFRAYNGQVAVEDGTVDVAGVAPGLNEVLVVLVDTRGRVATDRVTVEDDDTFEEDDIPLVTRNGRDLNEGDIRAVLIGLGRDGVAGDGLLPGQERADLGALEDYLLTIGPGLTQDQVIARLSDETTDEVASDDLSIRERFRYTDGSTTIESVRAVVDSGGGIQEIEVGETMRVQGLTNRKADDNTISVEVVEGPSAGEFSANSTDDWGLDGIWTVTLETRGVEPGTYTIEADDGDNTDTVDVEIVAANGDGNG
jgi:major cell surface glycoprotein (TIGR04216 family)